MFEENLMPLPMELVKFPETSVSKHQTTLYNTPAENTHLYTCRHPNLKSVQSRLFIS
jgi:hypothetical protein